MTQGKNIRLLAVDMDGTCLNSRSQMTAETIRALEAAAKAGIIVVPTTGRSLSCLPHRLSGRLQRKEGMDADFDSKGAGTAPGQSLQRKI